MDAETTQLLECRLVRKPWGRTSLPRIFGETKGQRIGEVWFVAAYNLPLLAKYIFTSESLSIQNHPDEAHARARGLPHGKEECWYVLEAEPGATLGIGWKRRVEKDEISAAAADGSIVNLIDWKPVAAGDFYYIPAGVVHAIGAGVSLLEVQQNSDVTYRIYDYGRPRDLHLEDAIEVARVEPYADSRSRRVGRGESAVLVDGPYFSLAQVDRRNSVAEVMDGRRRWVMPIEGIVRSSEIVARPGHCLLVGASDQFEVVEGRALVAAEGRINKL
jgi:mannose-6-phosphate isomerase